MTFLDHIAACNNANVSNFLPFWIDGRRLGWIPPETEAVLRALPRLFRLEEQGATLIPKGFDARSAAIAEAGGLLRERGISPPLRNENYNVVARWGDAPLLVADRALMPFFGFCSFGVHVNGVVRTGNGLSLWIAKRAGDREIAPGMLDNMVAGGQPAGLSLMENVVKESKEEAGISADLAQMAHPVGAIGYQMEMGGCLKPDVLFLYDLFLPEGFEPRNSDGEVENFRLTPVEEVMEKVRAGGVFKFNVNLVLIDFFIRHGCLTADRDGSYLELSAGLRRFSS